MTAGPAPAARVVAAFLGLVIVLAMPSTCHGQGMFGKNKVQYSDLEWREVEGSHVRVYFYAQEQDLACAAVELADSMSAILADSFRHEPRKKIPLVLYSSQRDFAYSNIVPFLLPEEVAGLTEFAKGRVLIPYTGSYYRFRWVLFHELTHAFVMEKIASVLDERKKPLNYSPPMWFSEGLAEYMAASPSPAMEALLRDAVLSENLVPLDRMWSLSGSIMVYREGQSLVTYIADRFGFAAIASVLDDWGAEKTFEGLLSKHLGVSMRDLNDGWVRSLKENYYPSVRERQAPSEFAVRVTRGERPCLSPVWLPAGGGEGELAYVTAQAETEELRVVELGSAPDKARDRPLVKAGNSRQYESLHLFRSRLSAGRSGLVVFSAQKGERDAIYLVDPKSGRRVSTVELPGLLALSSPVVSPEGGRIAVIGQDASGQVDLYVVDVRGGSLLRLTRDGFDDRDPDWAPDGQSLVFASDRCDTSLAGRYRIFSSPAEGGEAACLTDGDWSSTEPRYSPSGKYLAFVSDRGGVPDLWLLDTRDLSSARVTRSLAGVQMPAWGDNDSTVYVVCLADGRYTIDRVDVRPDSLAWEGKGEATAFPRCAPAEARPVPAAQSGCGALAGARKYRPRFGLDFARTTMGYDPEFVGGGSGQLALSDMLSNRHLLIYLSSESEEGGDLLGTLSAGASYLDLAGRMSYGFGVFSLGTVYDEELDVLRQERHTGVLLYAAYPTSRFERVEGNVVARYSDDYLYRNGERGRIVLLSDYLSYVWDNTGLTGTGELIGSRVYLTVGITRDVTRGVADYALAQADLRRSAQLAQHIVLAARLEWRSTFGREGRRFYLGGPSTLRGYGTRTISGKKVLLWNSEIRLPLLARVAFRLPGGAFPFPTIKGALFFDAATGGDDDFEPWKGSLGVGFYLGGGYFPAVRFNLAWRTDFETVSKEPVREFTVGWNY